MQNNSFTLFIKSTPITTTLIVLLVLIELVNGVLGDTLFTSSIVLLGRDIGEQPWKIFTAPWFNGDIIAALFRCLILFYYLPMLERSLPIKKLITYVLIWAITPMIVAKVFTIAIPTVSVLYGTTGIVAGVLTYIYYHFGYQQILVFPLSQPTKLKYVIIFLLILFIIISVSTRHYVSLFHLSSALLVAIQCKILPLIKRKDQELGRDSKKKYESKIKPRSRLNTTPETISKVDQILDKISEKGFQSLTEKEREILDEAANKK